MVALHNDLLRTKYLLYSATEDIEYLTYSVRVPQKLSLQGLSPLTLSYKKSTERF